MYSLQIKTHHQSNSAELFLIVAEIMYAYFFTFTPCEIGQRITNAFDECSDTLNQFHWYLFTPGIQRMLPMIIQFTQEPIVLYCFGTKAAIRDTFKYVCINHLQVIYFFISLLLFLTQSLGSYIKFYSHMPL